MSCTEPRLRLGLGLLALLAGCSAPPPPAPPSLPAPTKMPSAAPAPGPQSKSPVPIGAPPGPVSLPPPARVGDWAAVRLQAARRLVAANPSGTYTGPVPDPLLAIPVLEIELNGDGSVRRIVVLRPPRQAKDTIGLATAAIHRAAPFGDVSHLPKPWRFTETFLFDDDRKFMPRTLVP